MYKKRKRITSNQTVLFNIGYTLVLRSQDSNMKQVSKTTDLNCRSSQIINVSGRNLSQRSEGRISTMTRVTKSRFFHIDEHLLTKWYFVQHCCKSTYALIWTVDDPCFVAYVWWSFFETLRVLRILNGSHRTRDALLCHRRLPCK